MLNRVKEITKLLKVLANENRLSIVCYLIEKTMSNSTSLITALDYVENE